MWIIDRIEEDKAVIECNGEVFDIPLWALPENAKESDVIDISVNSEETKKRMEDARSLMDSIFKNDDDF